VGITRDREGLPATSGTRGVNPYGTGGLVVTGASGGRGVFPGGTSTPRDGKGVPSRLGVRGIARGPRGVGTQETGGNRGAPQKVATGT